MYLSKSKYCLGYQCLKLLWLKKNKPEEEEITDNSSVFENGNQVGELAKGLFGDYINIEYGDLSKMITDTLDVISKNNVCNICEASFNYNNNFCSVDILKKNNNSYEIYEVKSSTHVNDIYLEDASYQYYVLSNLGYKVDKVCIVYLNSSYVRDGELDIDKLFNIEDVTDTCISKLDEVAKRIKEINNICDSDKELGDSVSINCFDPYPCPFFKYCTKHLTSPNVFNIDSMRKNKMIEYYDRGITSFNDLINEDLNPRYLEQIDYEINNKPDKIEIDEIKSFLSTLNYPLYFLDFETYQQTIPLYDGISPYQQIPFQYSLHYIEEFGGELKHTEFLAESGVDPRRSLAEALVKDIPMDVCTLAYNMSFEKNVISKLAELYPDLSNHLLNIKDNIKDLEVPFAKRNYYNKLMKGKSSIKYVLPALFPDDPDLDYHNLEGVHNGSEAMNAFANLEKLSKEEQLVIRNNLLKYCCLDTYAMVKIYYKLLEVVKEKAKD